MSKYTTGEMAKLCHVSVRTVQYYDDRGILTPSKLSEGGRRLYSEEDYKRLRVICFLREVGFPINSIAAILSEKHPEGILTVILEEQEKSLREELSACEEKLHLVEGLKRELKDRRHFSVESLGDIAYVMKNKDKLRNMRWMMVLLGIPVTAYQWISIVLWITGGLWWPFVLWIPLAAIYGTWASVYYMRHAAYICPECHEVFQPKGRESFFAYHTPRMRRLTCPKCHGKSLCLEVYAENRQKETDNFGHKT